MSFDQQQQQQQQVGAGAAGAGKGFDSVAVRDEASCIVQQESSGESGSTLKAHDYIGLSEVTSMPLKMSSPNVPDLNLGETELRLGPPKSKNSSEEAPKEHKGDAKNSKNNEAVTDLQAPQNNSNNNNNSSSNVFSWPPRMIQQQQQQQENPSEMPFASVNVSIQQKNSNKRGFSEAIGSSGNGFVEGRSVIPPPPAANPSSVPANQKNNSNNSNSSNNNNNGKNALMASPMYPWSSSSNNNNKQQQITAAWRMGLEQSKGSFGPFPSSRIDNNVATNKNKNNSNSSSSPNSSALTSNSAHKEDHHDEIAPSASPPVVGWPPVQSFRKNTLAAHPAPQPPPPQHKSSSSSPSPTIAGGETKISAPPSAAAAAASNAPNPSTALSAAAASPLFVKVYMDGVPIGRKVDLKANNSYEKLSSVLEDMFHRFISGQNGGPEVSSSSTGAEKKLNFLQSSDFVLTYEDKDGDLMLVGDVPWGMFTGTVKRLRIMKGSEAIGLAPRDKAACQA